MSDPKIIVFDDLDSTSAEARRRALTGEAGPVWLMARRQSAGHGRRGRAWATGEDNLAATLLFTLDMPPLQAAQLGFVTALAVADLIDTYVPTALVRLKWPNDVLIDGRKTAGILIESGPAAAGGLWVSVGVGVNLVSFPKDVEQPATALAEALREDVARAPNQDEAMERLAAAFQQRFGQWIDQGFEVIRQAWLKRALGLGLPCSARLPGQSIEGVAESLDADGALLIRLPDHSLARVAAGDVFFGIT